MGLEPTPYLLSYDCYQHKGISFYPVDLQENVLVAGLKPTTFRNETLGDSKRTSIN